MWKRFHILLEVLNVKKSGVLHAELSKIIAALGHTQSLVIADYGLPVPKQVPVIDLAVRSGVPSFKDVLLTVLEELTVESATVAAELEISNNGLFQELRHLFQCEVNAVSHAELKEELVNAAAVVRTGEHSPYANVILRAGVVF